MKQDKLCIIFMLLFCTVNVSAQQVLFQRNVEGLVMDLETLSDGSYVSVDFISFDPEYEVAFMIMDKKLRSHEIKHSSYQFLNVAYAGIRRSGPHFYIPFFTVRPFGQGSGASIEGMLIGKYDQNGNELWLKKPTGTSSEFYTSFCSLLPDSNLVKLIYIDSLGMLTFETFDEAGNSIQVKPIDTIADEVYGLYKIEENKFVSFCRKDFHETYPGDVSILMFNDSGEILVNKKIFPDSINSSIEGCVVYGNNLYAIASTQDTATLLTNTYLVKYDREVNLLRTTRLNHLVSTGAPADLSLSTDHQLYVFYHTDEGNIITSHLEKFDFDLTRKWSYSFDRIIRSVDTATCNGVLVAFWTGNDHYTTIKGILDPELPDVCNRCDIKAYPNPTTDGNITFQTQYSDVSIVKTEWYDANGKLVWQSLGDQDKLHYAQPFILASGTYYTVTTCDNDKSAQRRVIIAK